MASTLSELLERIRPAGAPGAPSDGALQRQHDDRANEVDALVTALAAFQAEADEVLARAQMEADRLRGDGDRRVREISAGLARAIAVAESEAASVTDERDRPQASKVDTETQETISQLRARAAVEIPQLVDAAITVIWDLIPPSPTSEPNQ